MPLLVGSRIGPYDIVAQIGAGGMGVVYRGRDARLKRDVALKVLPDDLAGDAEHIARFQREAELLAGLTHPNIAALYGLEDAAGTRALVMECIEGDTLADRIALGLAPIDEALAIARQIADALDYAHERGVLHRDLKPANIKMTLDGQVKLLDFGLAKAMLAADGSRVSAKAEGAHDLTHLPTLTSPVMTQAGVLMGAAAYMSPEQARGKPAHHRLRGDCRSNRPSTCCRRLSRAIEAADTNQPCGVASRDSRATRSTCRCYVPDAGEQRHLSNRPRTVASVQANCADS